MIPKTMTGAVLPGDSTVELREFDVPAPGPGQVLLRVGASSICGSDIRAIYRAHLGTGPEAYQPGTIAGHEPAGRVVQLGPDCKHLTVGDRVSVYHITGCGSCRDCMEGYMISCSSPQHRKAHGWQRHGGHAPYMLTEETACVVLPDSLSYVDGAFCACGFGTVYEALVRMGVSGTDALLVTGLGPVGLAAAMLGRAMGARTVIGTDISAGRLALAERKGLVDHALDAGGDEDSLAGRIRELTGGRGCERSIDCSGAPAGRHLALRCTRQWGRCAYVGEGGNVEFDVSGLLIHKQITLYGSWVTSTKHLADLVEFLDRHDLRPEQTSDSAAMFPLDQAAEAYRTADAGQTGKVCILFDDVGG